MTSGVRRLGILFLAVIVPTAATLVWLGLRLVDNEQTLWAQSVKERLERDADGAVRVLRQQLDASLDETRPHTVRFRIGPRSISPDDGSRVLWLPIVPVQSDVAEQFSAFEMQEFGGQAGTALSGYLELAKSTNRATAAAALMRAARVYRVRREWDSALLIYSRMAAFTDTRIDQTPADLLARRASCDVLAQAGRTPELARTAERLAEDFAAGLWALDIADWELTRRHIEQWVGRPVPINTEARTFTAATDALWRDWTDGEWRTLRGLHRRMIEVDGKAVTVVERQDERGAVASVLLPEAVQSIVTAMTSSDSVRLLNGEQVVAGATPPSQVLVATRLPGQTLLPWTVALVAATDGVAARDLAERRRLLLWGLAAIVFLLAGGGYLLWRVVQRELAVARLQTEFVAAVSHEFRTPLASLRHVTELLDEDDELPPGERRTFYQALGRNTERLNRLVESLLDFARMESGRKPYALHVVDARSLAARVATDFGAEVSARGYCVELDAGETHDLRVEADEDSLSHALWNLLDNAVKYSPDHRHVVLSVRAHPQGVAFAVTDQGVGIPASEHSHIFGRFVRGTRARELGIKGTGLGLAMVQHIVQAHKGRVEVESHEGTGSTFRIVLPEAA